MQLLQHDLQLLRNRQAKVTGVLQKAHTLVGEVEENDCRAEHRARCDHIDVDDVRDAYQHEDDDLAADTFEADLAGQLFIGYRAHDTGDVIGNSKEHQSEQQAVAAAEEVAKPSSGSGEKKLAQVPKLFHSENPPLT